jgi:integrase/recombinase XerC
MPTELTVSEAKTWGDKVFAGVPVADELPSLFDRYLADHDFAANTRRAVANDLRKFVVWFTSTNGEALALARITARDVSDFKDWLRREQAHAVATVNRGLVSLRRFLGWLADQGHIASNPARKVKELRHQRLAPKGLDRATVRRLLRELELRADARGHAIFSLLLYTGARVGDVVELELADVDLHKKRVTFRHGKGGKERTVPLPTPARQSLEAYLDTRPPVPSPKLFWGQRGPLTTRGIRSLCAKYGKLLGVHLHPHAFRHTMAHRFLDSTSNDLVSLAQILGHESLQTTRRYAHRSEQQLADVAEKLSY